MKKNILKKCPSCKKKTYIISIFGSICSSCFYEPPKPQPKCKNCYDKGFFTQLIGGTRTATDFGKLEYHFTASEIRKNYCTKCAKGRRLKKLNKK